MGVVGLPMGFGYPLYPSYNGYNGGGKGIDKMIDQWLVKHDELPAVPTERRLLFLHRGIGGAPESAVDRKYSRIMNCFPRERGGNILLFASRHLPKLARPQCFT
jgi:hypothetical protein